MIGKRYSKLLAAAGGMMLASWCMGSAGNAAETITGFAITSTTFQDGGLLPARTAYTKAENFPNCVGQNISPQLSWTNPAPGVKSFAIVMFDIEDIINDTDLVAYGIPANVSSFAEGDLSKPSPNFVGGRGSRGQPTWRGMCPPPGTALHHYAFMIRGTDLDPKELPPGLTSAELTDRLKGHLKGTAAIVGVFKRPNQ